MASCSLLASCWTPVKHPSISNSPYLCHFTLGLHPARLLLARPARRKGNSFGRKGKALKVQSFARRVVDVAAVDDNKFKSFALRRAVYDHEDWKRHESSGRYFRHFKSMFSSKVIAALGPPVGLIAAIACAVVGWNTLVLSGFFPAGTTVLHMSSLPFSLTSPALSLLLVFRTNTSYARFDEARKMLGLMLNRTRDVCRQALTYMARDCYAHETPKRDQLLRHLQAFPLIFKHHFLQESSLEVDLKMLTSLNEQEMKNILATKHRPNYCLHMMSECSGRCHMDVASRLAIEQNFSIFADDIGGAERIFKTPIPLSYTRMTSRFLIVYHLFLPFALYDSLGWITIPATILHAGVFFCIDEVGALIENPFPVLALDAVAQSARENIAEMVALHKQVEDQVEEDYALRSSLVSEHRTRDLDVLAGTFEVHRMLLEAGLNIVSKLAR